LLPTSLADVTTAQPYNKIPTDPQGNTINMDGGYQYKKTGEMTFELCATFNKENMETEKNISDIGMPSIGGKSDYLQNNNWNHGFGHICFPRTINPEIYPTQVRG
jgi:hypothetical protein